MICIPTPRSILEDDNRDVIAEIIPDSEKYYLDKRKILLSRYGYRGIGNCDIDYWVNCMKSRYAEIVTEYDLKLDVFEKLKDPLDLSEESYHNTTTTDYEDTPSSQIESEKYLSNRTTITSDGSREVGLKSITISQYSDAIRDPLINFALEFKDLFYFGV